MLDDVRHVGELAVDPCLLERLVEQAPGGPDERPAGQVLLIARLFPDQDDLRPGRAFAEDRLRGVLVQVAVGARRRHFPDRFERRILRLEEFLGHAGCLPWSG